MLFRWEKVFDLNHIGLIQFDFPKIGRLLLYLSFHVLKYQFLNIGWQVHNIYIVVLLFKGRKHLHEIFIFFVFILFFILYYGLALISLIFEGLELLNHLPMLLSLLTVGFLFLLVLLFNEVIFDIELLMEAWADPRELKALRNVPFFEPCFNLVLEHYELHFHFGINVPLFVSRPEAPKSIANYIAFGRLDLFPKNVFPEL